MAGEIEAGAIWNLGNALSQAAGEATKAQDAIVTHTDPDGTAWVHFPGGVDETPTASRTTEVQPGDVVPVTVENGRAMIINGSSSNPSVSLAFLNGLLASTVKELREDIGGGVGEVEERLAEDLVLLDETVNESIQEAKDAAAATAQNFYHDGNGAHVTTSESDANLLMNAIGILLRTADHVDLSVTRGAATFYDSDGNVMASYTKNGIVIGKSSTYHMGITPSGLALYGSNGRTVVAQITGSSLSISGYATDDELDAVDAKAGNAATAAGNAQAAAGNAQATANDAASAASDAAKVATDYLDYGTSNKSSGGLDVGFSGSNARTNIKTDGVRVYNQSGEQMAHFGSDIVLGKTGDWNAKMTTSAMDFRLADTTKMRISQGDSGHGMVEFGVDNSGYRNIQGRADSGFSMVYILNQALGYDVSMDFNIDSSGAYIDASISKQRSSGSNVYDFVSSARLGAGGLVLNGHSSAIGTVKNASGTTAKSVDDGMWHCGIGTISLDEGVWLLIGKARFESNSTGSRQLAFGSDTSDPGTNTFSRVTQAAHGVNRMQTTTTASLTGTTTYYLKAYQNSGGKLNVESWYIRAVRIA